MKNRWKYSVNQCLFDGNIIFALKDSHEKNMFVLNTSSIQFHVSIISCKFRSPFKRSECLGLCRILEPEGGEKPLYDLW